MAWRERNEHRDSTAVRVVSVEAKLCSWIRAHQVSKRAAANAGTNCTAVRSMFPMFYALYTFLGV